MVAITFKPICLSQMTRTLPEIYASAGSMRSSEGEWQSFSFKPQRDAEDRATLRDDDVFPRNAECEAAVPEVRLRVFHRSSLAAQTRVSLR